MLLNARLAGESRRLIDVAVVVAYSVLSVGWFTLDPLRAQSVGEDGTAWYVRTHMCALDRQADCDE